MTHGQLAEAHGTLSRKVAAQAAELTEAHGALRAAGAYTRLLERRLLEAVPDHPLPVMEGHLGLPLTSLSRLAVTAAAALLASPAVSGPVTLSGTLGPSGMGGAAGAAAAAVESTAVAAALAAAGGDGGDRAFGDTVNAAMAQSLGAGAGPGGSLAARASHIIAATAAHRREASDASDAIRRLEKSVSAGGCSAAALRLRQQAMISVLPLTRIFPAAPSSFILFLNASLLPCFAVLPLLCASLSSSSLSARCCS